MRRRLLAAGSGRPVCCAGVRVLGECAAAGLKERRRTLKRMTLSLCRIGDIARAALVLNGIWK
ncbi:predicted protein [Streptomyces viridochromogenes DSM 40736]|uniref:Predicted protein n=1 Tax=Streptomyces viridochromogenes (strain DSM 40736 / JCM 4977 / BCRC 1201 / Tue 494) TaxID=591159 RepID=D9XHU1_STRVT|nr:predicted protein [Streptomyces viridochromogenes DSM 40736]